MVDNPEKIKIYKQYIKEKPDKPHGYYYLGKIYLAESNIKKAYSYFKKALKTDSNYMFAQIGIIEIFLLQSKIIKALNFYKKNHYKIISKRIYTKKLIKTISSKYNMKLFKEGFLAAFTFKRTIKHLNKMFNDDPYNILANLLLCIYYLDSEKSNDRALTLYYLCLNLQGLNDDMRWNLVKAIAKDNLTIYEDIDIAKKFETIPSNNCTDSYKSFILKAALYEGRMRKIVRLADMLKANTESMDLSDQWKLVNLCNEESIINETAYYFCTNLINKGWVDSVVADFIKKMNDEKFYCKQQIKTLNLFGYQV